ncbi:MAG TPA: hypothetical protein VIH42_02735 [Thermoguttaceae bacterium]
MTFIIRWMDKLFLRVRRGYWFVGDTLYYLERGHNFRDAVRMAHRVWPGV